MVLSLGGDSENVGCSDIVNSNGVVSYSDVLVVVMMP